MGYMVTRFALFAALVVIGTLNRETTGVLLWFSFVAMYPQKWRWWLLYGGLIAGIQIGLHLVVPANSSPYTPELVWHLNTATWNADAVPVYWELLFPALLFLFWKPRRQLRIPVLVVLIPYLILYFTMGIWQETRLLMPAFLMGIPVLRINAIPEQIAEADTPPTAR